MKIKFWGVRGSIPTPVSSEQIRSKITAVVQRIKEKDLVTAIARETFIASLPPALFGTVGGNTTCLEVRNDSKMLFILDAGSGIRELGNSLESSPHRIRDFHIFFTHFHWDHLQGLPFFTPSMISGNRIHFYSPLPDIESYLRKQMIQPYFPIGMEAMNADLYFNTLEGDALELGGFTIRWKAMKHPGGCFAYKFEENGKQMIFATDSEITEEELVSDMELQSFFQGAEILVLDSQYTLEESFTKLDWGHTAYSMAVNLAVDWGVKIVVLFHHEPRYDDNKVYHVLNSAKSHYKLLSEEQILGTETASKKLQIITATEGKVLNL